MRVLALLLLAAPLLADPFELPAREKAGFADAATYGRYAESLALQRDAIARNPADVRALERAITILERFGKSADLEETVRKAKKRELPLEQLAAVHGLLGRLLVTKASRLGRRIILFGNNARRPLLTNEQEKLYIEAVVHLRAALAADKRAERARNDLANALAALDPDKNADEVRRLRVEAAALHATELRVRPELVLHDLHAGRIRADAETLEQRPDPDHSAALLLRQKALVLDYCTHTIPFEYTEPLYVPVSLLADKALINRNLRRTYLTTKGDTDYVDPLYHAAKLERKRKIVAELAKDPSSNAAAVLLVLVARSPDPTLADAALESLAAGKHPAAGEHLPRLLDVALFGSPQRFPVQGQQRLVEAARRLGAREAAPVLARFLNDDKEIDWPRDLARALGELGRPEDVAALLALARNPERDVYFRRQAIGALGRLAPERLDDVPAESYLELALAAARFRNAPTESLRGRILVGLQHEHEADEAARFCVQFKIREAVPEMETFLAQHAGHYAKLEIEAAIRALVAGN